MNGIDPYAYLTHVSMKMDSLTQRNEIETVLDEVSCYAMRRLNPFLGVLQVVETTYGRASTANGLVWHIEVLVEKLRGWGSLGSIDEDKALNLYDLWSETDGLVESPSGARIIGK